MAPLLTTDDLDDLGAEVMRARDPRRYAAELVAAVDGQRLADPDDAGFALSLAAEARERAGEHEEAVALSQRAVSAGAGTVDGFWLHASHAERLLRLGREVEGMAELTGMRPLLLREVTAVGPIAEALTETGHRELAEQWLTAAMVTAIEREERLPEGSDEQLDAGELVDELVGVRRVVRADLGLAPDEYDELADELDAAPDVLFWPEAAFTRLVTAQPDLADEIGRDWDAHRALVEAALQAADADGEILEVEVATPQLVTAMLAETDPGTDPAPGPLLAWPPGRNDPCWCGSRAKYKKCCLPRARAVAAAGPAAPEPAAPNRGTAGPGAADSGAGDPAAPDTAAPDSGTAGPGAIGPAPAVASGPVPAPTSERVLTRRSAPRRRAR